jgi:hypothetical protein
MRIGCLRASTFTLALFLTVDTFVCPPFGFTWFRRLLGGGQHWQTPPTPCGFDFEGSWQIGLMKDGTSPWQWGENATAATHGGGIDTPRPILTCADVVGAGAPPASFVAHPFLVRASTTWFLFYELKNLARSPPAGEIGVSASVDGGASWEWRGLALTEAFHLSYPRVTWCEARQTYQMIPETSAVREVRVYETTAAVFPFGWAVVHTPLRGERFVDTAAVWHDHRFYIFTTVAGSDNLRIYSAEALTDAWVEHPASPVVVAKRDLARSAGPPVVYNGHVYRFAQRGVSFYGEGVHVLRVHVLTPTAYGHVTSSARVHSPPSSPRSVGCCGTNTRSHASKPSGTDGFAFAAKSALTLAQTTSMKRSSAQ